MGWWGEWGPRGGETLRVQQNSFSIMSGFSSLCLRSNFLMRMRSKSHASPLNMPASCCSSDILSRWVLWRSRCLKLLPFFFTVLFTGYSIMGTELSEENGSPVPHTASGNWRREVGEEKSILVTAILPRLRRRAGGNTISTFGENWVISVGKAERDF